MPATAENEVEPDKRRHGRGERTLDDGEAHAASPDAYKPSRRDGGAGDLGCASVRREAGRHHPPGNRRRKQPLHQAG